MLNYTVKTENPGKTVTLTFAGVDRAPITVTTGIDCLAVFTGISGSNEITTNDRIVSVVTQTVD